MIIAHERAGDVAPRASFSCGCCATLSRRFEPRRNTDLPANLRITEKLAEALALGNIPTLPTGGMRSLSTSYLDSSEGDIAVGYFYHMASSSGIACKTEAALRCSPKQGTFLVKHRTDQSILEGSQRRDGFVLISAGSL